MPPGCARRIPADCYFWRFLRFGSARLRVWHGDCVENNAARAVELYTRAGDAGHGGSLFNLGVCYERGDGVEKDVAKAVELYTRAADVGDMTAIYNLGYLLLVRQWGG
jgi:TPR repeat protein